MYRGNINTVIQCLRLFNRITQHTNTICLIGIKFINSTCQSTLLICYNIVLQNWISS